MDQDLLDDLDELDGAESGDEENPHSQDAGYRMQMQVDGEDNGRYGDGELEGDGDGIDGDMIDDIEDDEDPLQGRQADVKAIAKLMSSKQVQDLLQV